MPVKFHWMLVNSAVTVFAAIVVVDLLSGFPMSLLLRNVREYRRSSVLVGRTALEEFPDKIKAIAAEHRPSRMPFFQNLRKLPKPVASSPEILGQIYLVYQAAMHATRAAVYFMPHLNCPALRRRKLQIYVDDDGLPAAKPITTSSLARSAISRGAADRR